MKVIRIAASCLLGLVIAMLVVGLVEMGGLVFHPLPADFRAMSEDDLAAHARAAPAAAKLVVVVAWMLGAFAGTWVAGRVAGPGLHRFGLIVAAFLLGACVQSLVMIPSPAWMWVLGLLLPAAGALAGCRLARLPPGALEEADPGAEPPTAASS